VSEIKPALTSEEWEHFEFATGERPGDTLFGYINPDTRALHLGWNGDGMKPVKNSAPLAALALYGQPFGFTREDVTKLRAVLESLIGYPSHEWDTIESVADRIEALLPPEPPREHGVAVTDLPIDMLR
jgi:hypothetical protein